MPYKSKEQDRAWHREYMRKKAGVKAGVKESLCEGVKPSKRPHMGFEQPRVEEELDADGNIIPEDN